MRDRYEDDNDYDEDVREPGWFARLGARISLWSGAILALAIIVGLIVWGYRLTQRDASAIPVIHAALTPAKVQPEEPPATETPKTITSYSAGGGQPTAPSIAFAPPPERPASEDVAMGQLGTTPETPPVVAAAPEDPGTPPGSFGDSTDLAPEISRPAPTRPRDLKQRMDEARSAASADEVLAALAEVSIVQIQLGAFPDRDQTESEWERIYKANEDILNGRALVVQGTISGGKRFFRMRAGPFKDRVEAQNVCRALLARGQDCLVTVNG
jgi:hypothetical protein